MAASLTISAACLLCLYAYACGISPREVGIGDIGSDDIGAFVRTQGHVREVETIGAGGLKAELFDYADFATIAAYLPAKVARSIGFLAEIVPGSELSVAGEVQEFNGELEISVSDASMVRLLAGATGNRVGLGTLAANALTFEDMRVFVRGTISELELIIDYDKVMIHSGGHSFWVDDDGRHRISGRADVFGEVLWNEGRDRFEIKVAGDDDTIAPHPTAVPGAYVVVSLEALAGAPQNWAGRFVAVLDVSMIPGEAIGTSFTLSDNVDGEFSRISCMIFGWSWSADDHDMTDGLVVEFFGTWGYYESEARWQITSDEFTLVPWT